jgi:hypothetical protein
MLSIAIKNIILVTLIILILHFLLKNFALSRTSVAATSSHLSETKKEGECQAPNGFLIERFEPPTLQNPTQAPPPVSAETTVHSDELVDASFEAYFREPSPSLPTSSCAKVPDATEDLRPNALCGPDMIPSSPEDDKKTVKGDCDLKQDKKVFMLTTEYENENNMSGGDLGAFDAFDIYYETYDKN